MPKISVIIPVYNVEKYLKECLDSILNQTFQDFEVICVDDCSKDNSYKIIDEYSKADSRFRVLKQTHNCGAGAARNFGLEHANGKYIQFLDSDDYFEPKMFETLYNNAVQYNSDISVCSSRKVDDEGNITESRNPNSPINLDKTPMGKVFSFKDFPEDIFSMIGTMPWNKLYKKGMLDKNNLHFPDLTGPDDLCFVHCANVCAESIVVVDDELINYRFNRPGSVQTYRADHAVDIIRAGLYIKEFLKSKNLYEFLEPAYKKAMIQSIRWETSLCDNAQYEKFLKEFKELMPNDWQIFESALKKDYITYNYLSDLIGDKKVMLWGAGFFTQKLLADEKEKNPNILGIIDRNVASWGKTLGNYTIYSPDSIKEFEPEGVIMMILNNHESVYATMQKEFEEKYRPTELLPDIFELR